MLVNFFLFVCMPIVCILAFTAGFLCGKKKHKILWTIPALLFIIVLYILSKFPTLDYYLFPFYIYGRLRFFIPLIPLIFLFGIAAQFRNNSSRKVLYTAIAGFCIVAYLYIQCNIIYFDYTTLRGRISNDGCCMQSSGHTCGPAAATTLLLHHKIQSSEKK